MEKSVTWKKSRSWISWAPNEVTELVAELILRSTNPDKRKNPSGSLVQNVVVELWRDNGDF
jgi:hypothetical protein